MIDQAPHSLYLHVPFCVSKCPYCDFNSHVGLEGLFESYSRALVSEITTWGRELGRPRLDTIFIGGGTPSRVPAPHIGAALDAVRRSFDLAPDAEVTLEANPQSAESDKMEAWLGAASTVSASASRAWMPARWPSWSAPTMPTRRSASLVVPAGRASATSPAISSSPSPA